MQRLFSSFPSGRPGVGLLLLRATVGLALMVQGGACLTGGHPRSGAWAVGPLVLMTGALLLIGCLTPIVSFLAGLISVGLTLSWLPWLIPDVFGGVPATIFLAVMAAAIFLLGPGAFSLDAHWFGRRELLIPRSRDL